jgi:FkbM family methyltransferase
MHWPDPIKPWYFYRPVQLLRRLWRGICPPAEPVQVVWLPWGCSIEVDIRETIGRSIWHIGVYELSTAEVLWRLTNRQMLAIDVGANIGAMTGLLAAKAAEVWAFEPHPELASRLRRNVSRFSGRPGFAPSVVYELALSDRAGQARLAMPDDFANNHGLAQLVDLDTEEAADYREQLLVSTVRLDDLVGERTVGLMKLDVEGHELAVLHGAQAALASGRIRNLVFENHAGPGSPVCRLLQGYGYNLYLIQWRFTGPRLAPVDQPPRPYEPPNYLATREPATAQAICQKRGWHCLRSSPSEPC